MRVYYWIHHTGDYDGNTGVQRVVRNLASVLAKLDDVELVLVRWCAERQAIVRAEERYARGLSQFGGPALPVGPDPGAPIHVAAADRDRLSGAWLLLPEVPHLAGPNHPSLAVVLDHARYYGLRSVAIFYDLIPLLQPGYGALAPDHERYARALVGADLVLAISHYAGETLRRWWQAAGYEATRLPRLLAHPLPEEILGVPRVTSPREMPARPIRFAAFGTLEPRKNQIQAMQAFSRMCTRRPDLDVGFDLVGGLHSDVEARARSLARAQPRIRLHGYLPDAQLQDIVRSSHATVFLSLEEGYGLPVAESLWQGKPCLSSDNGAVAEVAAGGGCLMVDATDVAAIEAGFEQLAEDAGLRRRLVQEACTRPLRSWRAYGVGIAAALAKSRTPDRLVLIETGDHRADRLATALAGGEARLRRLHWYAASRALLPGTAGSIEQPAPGDGQLQGWWALLPAGVAAAAEAGEIVALARALGTGIAWEATQDAAVVVAEPGCGRDALMVPVRPFDPDGWDRLLAARPRLTEAGAPQRPKRVYYWVGLTVTQPFNTGVQRVARLLARSLQRLGVEVVPVKWDAAADAMVPISTEETKHLAKWGGPQPVAGAGLPQDLAGEWMLLPEITIPLVPPGSHVVRLAHSLGMRVAAIFYDLIPAKMPENYPSFALDYLTAYWGGFAEADVVLPISWTMAGDLSRWLHEQDLPVPPLVPCPLAGEGAGIARSTTPPVEGATLQLLAVGTWEPRKNYPRLLRALARARRQASRPIQLTIVGRRAGFAELDADIDRLAAEAGAELHDHVSDEKLLDLHETAEATVFASWEEGFGLPVLESLWRGRPCLCHVGSAMAEVAPGGGVLQIDMQDEDAITAALLRFADEPGLVGRLGVEAVTRPIRSWDDYAEDVLQALARIGAGPGWPLPAIIRRAPLLSCAISGCHHAPWLQHTLPRLLEAVRPWRDVVELVVCDDASSDDAKAVLARYAGERSFVLRRTQAGLGLSHSLAVAARHTRGAFVWLLAEGAWLVECPIEDLLEGVARHPEVELLCLNYGLADQPAQLASAEALMAGATLALPEGPNRRAPVMRNLARTLPARWPPDFACVLRRDHALRAYGQNAPDTGAGAGATPGSYIRAALWDRPAWWVGRPALVVPALRQEAAAEASG